MNGKYRQSINSFHQPFLMPIAFTIHHICTTSHDWIHSFVCVQRNIRVGFVMDRWLLCGKIISTIILNLRFWFIFFFCVEQTTKATMVDRLTLQTLFRLRCVRVRQTQTEKININTPPASEHNNSMFKMLFYGARDNKRRRRRRKKASKQEKHEKYAYKLWTKISAHNHKT